jgi:hypothetical protein
VIKTTEKTTPKIKPANTKLTTNKFFNALLKNLIHLIPTSQIILYNMKDKK